MCWGGGGSELNFISVLGTAFTHTQIPIAYKGADDLTVFFTLSESACLKAACKTMVKLTPGEATKNDLLILQI
jgi:hypothetical protein